MIAAGDLARGSRIQQDVLAARFNTSITPVREALRLLEAEGALVSEPHRGVRVADASYEQVKTAYIMRRLIESYAMRRAVRRVSPRDLDQAEKLMEEMVEAVAESDRVTLNRANREFHLLFYSRTGIDSLFQEIQNLWQQYPWDVLQVVDERLHETTDEHRAILDAARAGDGDAVAKATEVHLTNSFLALAQHMTGGPVADPFEIDND